MITMKKINKKSFLNPTENLASPNGAITAGGGYLIYLLYTMLVAGILMIVGSVVKGGCSCTCTCTDTWNEMASRQGYENNVITMAQNS